MGIVLNLERKAAVPQAPKRRWSLDALLRMSLAIESRTDPLAGTPLYEALLERAAEAREAKAHAYRDARALDLVAYRCWATAVADLKRFGWVVTDDGIERIEQDRT